MTAGRGLTLGRMGAENLPWIEGNSLGEGQGPFFVEGGQGKILWERGLGPSPPSPTIVGKS